MKRGTSTEGPYSTIATGVVLSAHTDNGVTNGTTYFYVVTAVDTATNESGNSNEDSATPSDMTPPAAPTGLVANAGDGSVTLDWADNGEPDLSHYDVKRATTQGGPYSTIATGVSISAHTDNGVTNGTTYYYVVTAVDTNSNESNNSNEASATPIPDMKLETFSVSAVSSTWQVVTLARTYTSLVIVCSPNYSSVDIPMVVRMRNASGNSFDVKVQTPSGTSLSGYTVYCMALEEGVYTVPLHGVKMEAAKATSTVTDGKTNSWVGESATYTNSYSSPVVVGQVMSANDADWSAFWASDGTQSNPPSSSALSVSKHVAEDSNTTRANETLGYVVVEAGNGVMDGIPFSAAVGTDTVEGIVESPPYTYTLTGMTSTGVAVVGSAGIDGGDGSWPVLHGASPFTATSLNLAVDEDQVTDSERTHTTEQVAYIVFEDAAGVAITPDNNATSTPESVISYVHTVTNTGGATDTIDITVTSTQGWTVALFESDGVTPLTDTDTDTIPDTGAVAAQGAVNIVVKVTVGWSSQNELTSVTATSSVDPARNSTAQDTTNALPTISVTLGDATLDLGTPDPGCEGYSDGTTVGELTVYVGTTGNDGCAYTWDDLSRIHRRTGMDGVRTAEGGEGVTGAMIRARIWVDGRLAGGLQALLGAPMAAYSGCGERDGGIGHGKRRSRTGLARVCGDVGLAGGSVADGRRQAGSGMARSRARARLNCSSQGQRRGRCRVNRRAERVIRPAKAKTHRLRVLVVTIC